MPHIYLQTNDGTKIALPEEAAALSAVVRRALDYWAERYGPPPPLPEEEDDDDDDSSDSDSERTPDRVVDDDDDPSTRTRSAAGSEQKKNNDTQGARGYRNEAGAADHSDDTDRTASIIDDDGDSRTPSICPSPDASSAAVTTTTSLRCRRKTPWRGNSNLRQGSIDEANRNSVDGCENGRVTPEFADLLNNGGEAVGDGEDSATPSTLDEDHEEEDGSVIDRGNVPCGQNLGCSKDTPPQPEPYPPTAEAHPFVSVSTTVTDVSVAMGDAHRNSERSCIGVNMRDTVTPPGSWVAVASPGGEPNRVVVRRDTTRVIVSSLGADDDDDDDDDDERFAWVDRVAAPSLSPKKITNEDFISPGSYHQRTPCMIGDEEDGLLISGSLPSVNEESLAVVSPQPQQQQQQHSNRSRERMSPCSGVDQTYAPLPHASKHADVVTRQQSAPRGNNLEPEGDGSAAPCENVVSSRVYQCARITDKEIVIELPNSFRLEDCKETVDHVSPLQSTAEARMSHNHSLLVSQASVTPDSTLDAPTSAGVAERVETSAARASSSSDTLARHSSIMAAAVSLCVTYLNHFSGDVPPKERLHPTQSPEPLTAPLVAILTSWEREFLYHDILGHTKEQLAVAMAIMQHAPDMSYIYPGPFLSNPSICTALMVDAPSAERVSVLASVMRVAEMLQIPSLQNMCTAWCADFIIRASYTSIDYFEAAALVRKCFKVENDWTKRERDCLKLENEWPSNEE